MPDPAEQNPDLAALLAAIRSLAQGVEKLQRSLDERRPESESISTAVERVAGRTEGMVGTVRALHERAQRVADELDSLRAEQAALARAMAEDEGRLAEIEQQQSLVQEEIGRIGDLEIRVGAIEAARAAGGPSGPPTPPGRRPTAGAAPFDDGNSDLRRQLEALLGYSPREVSDSDGPPEPSSISTISAAEAHELSTRLRRLERRDEAITSLLELVIERARVIARGEFDRG